MTSRLKDMGLDCNGLDLSQLETFGEGLSTWHRMMNWAIGDVARYTRRVFGDEMVPQVFPEWMSHDHIARCEAVANAYPRDEDRNLHATWTVHMREANKPDRIQRVQDHVDAGRTSDEARAFDKSRWLLAVDVNYFLHRFWHSGAGVEAANSVASWIDRTVNRLKPMGLTDCVCCFDDKENHRKALTADWEDKYKDRPPKDSELIHQLHIVRNLLEASFGCVSIHGMEGDDVMASYAAQFCGRVTLMTQDKDCRQCLGERCNILLDVEWSTDEITGNPVPDYKWMTAKSHTEETGIPPSRWIEYQCLMGDNVDGIKGAEGIGKKGAADLVTWFGTVDAVIEAAKNGEERIKPAKRVALLEFEAKADVTRKLVTLRTDLELPTSTRLS